MKLQDYCSVLNKDFADLSKKEKHGGVRVKAEHFKTMYTHRDVELGLDEIRNRGEVVHNDTHEEPYEAFVLDEPEVGDYVDEDGDEGSNNNTNGNRDSNNEVPHQRDDPREPNLHQEYYRFDSDYDGSVGAKQPHYCAYPGCTTRFTTIYLHRRHFYRVHAKKITIADAAPMAMDTTTTATAAAKRKPAPATSASPHTTATKKRKPTTTATATTAAAFNTTTAAQEANTTTATNTTIAAAATTITDTATEAGDPRPEYLDFLYEDTAVVKKAKKGVRSAAHKQLVKEYNSILDIITSYTPSTWPSDYLLTYLQLKSNHYKNWSENDVEELMQMIT